MVGPAQLNERQDSGGGLRMDERQNRTMVVSVIAGIFWQGSALLPIDTCACSSLNLQRERVVGGRQGVFVAHALSAP